MTERQGAQRALLVGVGRYDREHELPALPTPGNDVEGLARILRNPERCGFASVTDIRDPDSQRLCESVEELFASAGRDDLILFYFSGHGKLSPAGGLHLCATNTNGKTLIATSLPLAMLNQFVNTKPVAQVVIVLDCCFSGAAASIFKGADIESLVTKDLGQGQGKYVITSSSASQVSRANPKDKYSLFTKWLIDGLESGASDVDENGAITIEELFRYAKTRTVQEEPGQVPQSFTYEIRPGNVIIGRAQHPRRRVSSGGLVSTNPAFFKAVETRLAERRIVPFLGGGVFGNGPLSAFRLSSALGECAALTGQTDVATSAEYLVQLLDDREAFLHEFRTILEEQSAEVKRVTSHDLILCGSPPPLVISATYDFVLERRLESEGIPYTLVAHILGSRDGEHDGKLLVVRRGLVPSVEILPSDQFLLPSDGQLVIYKVVGSPFLSDFAGAGEVDTVVVTESDHLTFVGRLENQHTRVPNAFFIPFQMSCLLFLGYSLDLWHYRLILRVFGQGRSRLKKVYAVRQPTSQMEELYWQRFRCDMIKGDPEQFAEQFLRAHMPMAEAI